MNKDWENELEKYMVRYQNGHVRVVPERIKEFISNLLSTQRQEVISRIEDSIDDVIRTENSMEFYGNIKDLLADLKSGKTFCS